MSDKSDKVFPDGTYTKWMSLADIIEYSGKANRAYFRWEGDLMLVRIDGHPCRFTTRYNEVPGLASVTIASRLVKHLRNCPL